MTEHHDQPLDDGAPVVHEGDSVSLVGRHSGGRRRRRLGGGCLPILIVLAVLGAGGYLVVTKGIDSITSAFGGPDDYAGPGEGSVTVEVIDGQGTAAIGETLESQGVVASVEAFVDAAEEGGRANAIKAGVCKLRKEMSADEAVDLLVSRTTCGQAFTFTPGKTVDEIVELLARDTDVPRKDYEAALKKPQALGLPDDAEGNAEGYLGAGRLLIFPDDSAATILSAMVDNAIAAAEEADLEEAADRLGYSVHDLMTIASLVETEGSLLDERGKAKIARVVYNRLENPTAETIGRLQMDATVNYARGEKVAVPTQAQIDEVASSPYNTYTNAGLPPGPIATPSAAALQATVAPLDGPWFYYVTVNLDSGKTKFAIDYDAFLQLKAELRSYCDTQSDRC